MAREGLLTSERLTGVADDVSMHLRRMVFGEPGLAMSTATAAAIVSTLAIVIAAVGWRSARSDPAGDDLAPRLVRPAIYFGVIWMVLGIAPTVVAGYASPRHVYLASAGWAILLGIAIDVLWHARPVVMARMAAAMLALVALGGYATLLAGDVRTWETRTAISRRALEDFEREALAAPPGTLIIAGAPRSSWGFALPHALLPPFTGSDLPRRIRVISDSSLHCCPVYLWEDHTRRALGAWLADPRRPPVVALHWQPATGRLSRVSEREEPFLRQVMVYWLETRSREELDRQIHDALNRLVAGRTPR